MLRIESKLPVPVNQTALKLKNYTDAALYWLNTSSSVLYWLVTKGSHYRYSIEETSNQKLYNWKKKITLPKIYTFNTFEYIIPITWLD